MTTTWLKTENGYWINAAHILKIGLGDVSGLAHTSDGKTYEIDSDEVSHMAGHIIPAAPGHRLHFWDEEGLFPFGEPVIAWVVCPLYDNTSPVPVGDFTGIAWDSRQGYAIARPDGSWMIPDDGEFGDRAAIDAHLANRAVRKKP